MRHIEKIIIDNARRFGKDIEIDFGAGVTIILAPNGTGKTTIFEAIELALTGEVKRILDSKDAIIRDTLSEMSVRLNFSGDKYCQANYRRRQECEIEGNHAELFQIEDNLSAPYLLRLTHLLEQRGTQWFIEQDKDHAGELISKLPIGKDLHEILSKRTSLIRAITLAEARSNEDYDVAKERLIEFKALLSKRNEIKIETSLTPLEEILGRILPISKLVNYEVVNVDPNVVQINAYSERIISLLTQRIDKEGKTEIKLNVMKERVQQYAENLEVINKKQVTLSKYYEKKSDLAILMGPIKEEIQRTSDLLEKNKNDIIKSQYIKGLFEDAKKKTEQLTSKRVSLEKNKEEKNKLKHNHETTIKDFNENKTLSGKHKVIDELIIKEKKRLEQLELKKEFQKEWYILEEMNEEVIKPEIIKIEIDKQENSKQELLIDNEVTEKEKLYINKRDVVGALNKTSAVIQSAVSNIRKSLPKNERSCPVCKAEYEPDDLIGRIEESLNILNPDIGAASIEEENALKALNDAIENQNIAREKMRNIILQLDEQKSRLKDNIKIISDKLRPEFLSAKTSDEAKLEIEGQISQVIGSIEKLKGMKKQLKPMASVEEIYAMTIKKDEEERVIISLSEAIKKMEVEIEAETEKLNEMNKRVEKEDENIVLGKISSLFTMIEEEKSSIKILQDKLIKNEEELKRYQELIISEKEVISKIKANQEGIYAEWRQLGLEGQPNELVLDKGVGAIQKLLQELKVAHSDLSGIQQELAVWRTAEQFRDIDEEIKKKIGDKDIESYLGFLEKENSEKKRMREKLQERKKGIIFFLDSLKVESEQINKQIVAINEPWKRLLKRIVINPLISTAPLLSSSTYRNKQVAETSVIINGKNTNIAHIASEAQLADIQLTLMLAMANKYNWTPWKALLLDDPTQHHDLVHASSVFDVLRDYIIEFDYQIMMSTHDSMQANFFKRKLENEGIPSKIYQLVVREGGVTAELIG